MEDDFKCMDKSGHCVSKQLVCDGTEHCADGSDEYSEMCKQTDTVRIYFCIISFFYNVWKMLFV